MCCQEAGVGDSGVAGRSLSEENLDLGISRFWGSLKSAVELYCRPRVSALAGTSKTFVNQGVAEISEAIEALGIYSRSSLAERNPSDSSSSSVS